MPQVGSLGASITVANYPFPFPSLSPPHPFPAHDETLRLIHMKQGRTRIHPCPAGFCRSACSDGSAWAVVWKFCVNKKADNQDAQQAKQWAAAKKESQRAMKQKEDIV